MFFSTLVFFNQAAPPSGGDAHRKCGGSVAPAGLERPEETATSGMCQSSAAACGLGAKIHEHGFTNMEKVRARSIRK